MARPSSTELVKRAARTRAAIAEADPRSTAALVKARQRMLTKIADDAVWWYERMRKMVEDGTTKDDEPAVKLMLGILRTLAAEQKSFPMQGDNAPPKSATQVLIVVAGEGELKRGHAAARALAQGAIETHALPPTGETADLGGP
jgi:hypothetical protein